MNNLSYRKKNCSNSTLPHNNNLFLFSELHHVLIIIFIAIIIIIILYLSKPLILLLLSSSLSLLFQLIQFLYNDLTLKLALGFHMLFGSCLTDLASATHQKATFRKLGWHSLSLTKFCQTEWMFMDWKFLANLSQREIS